MDDDDIKIGVLIPIGQAQWGGADPRSLVDFAVRAGRLELTVGAAFPGPFGLPQHALSDVPWERRFTRLYDGWLPYPPAPAAYRDGLAAVRSAAAAAGRSAADVTPGARHLAVRIATTSLDTQREQLEQIIALRPLLKAT
jgi:hypothetical protein